MSSEIPVLPDLTEMLLDVTQITAVLTEPISDIVSVDDVLPELLTEILGTSASDLLIGTPNNDLIKGFGSRDTLNGGAGNDILVGGLGGDTLTGGGGSDQFVFDSFSERTDKVTDFNFSQDALVLTNLFVEIGYDDSTPINEYLLIKQQGLDTLVQIDPDGSGDFIFTIIARLENVVATTLDVGTNVII